MNAYDKRRAALAHYARMLAQLTAEQSIGTNTAGAVVLPVTGCNEAK